MQAIISIVINYLLKITGKNHSFGNSPGKKFLKPQKPMNFYGSKKTFFLKQIS